MRPRPLGRGNNRCSWFADCRGRCFNEAAAVGPRKHGSANRDGAANRLPASMRPRPLGRGNQGGGELRHGIGVASMRPRPLRRGNEGEIGTIGENDARASMRPRPLGRGNTIRSGFLNSRMWTGFNEAAAVGPRKHMPARASWRWASRCFNEAAAVGPRKRQQGVGQVVATYKLQ